MAQRLIGGKPTTAGVSEPLPSLDAAVRQFEMAMKAVGKLSIMAVPAAAPLAVSPFAEYSMPGETVTVADQAVAADDAEYRYTMNVSSLFTGTNGHQKNPRTGKYAIPLKASGAKPNLKVMHTNPAVQKGLKAKTTFLVGGKLLVSLNIPKYGDYRLYANVPAREGEDGYKEKSGVVADGCVYTKISAKELKQGDGIVNDKLLFDHSLSDKDAAMLRVIGVGVLADKAASQHVDVVSDTGVAHKLVPVASLVYRKYVGLGNPALVPIQGNMGLVLMDKKVYTEIMPFTQDVSNTYFAPIDPEDLELTLVPEPRLNEKGDPVETSFYGTMRRPVKPADELAERIDVTLSGIYTCHTCGCEKSE